MPRYAEQTRKRIIEGAYKLFRRQGYSRVTMDDIAVAAGVGKGTVFRRFGSRAGSMMVLLDEDERASQHAFMFGPPPLGPDAPPMDRLVAFGRARTKGEVVCTEGSQPRRCLVRRAEEHVEHGRIAHAP